VRGRSHTEERSESVGTSEREESSERVGSRVRK